MLTTADPIGTRRRFDTRTLGAHLASSRGLLFAIFTVSGFSGLIYESIWSHYLKLFLGHAAYAQTLVLAIFMGGMALGSWAVARYTHRLKNLLLGYAVVEAVTGVIAMLFHALHGAALELTFSSVIPALDSAAAVNLFKWTLAAALILPQSILLGTTFPLISGAVIRRFPDRSGETLAMLYFTNSLGASLGVLASGFWLVAAVGLPGTVMTAGLLNIALACIVWLLTRSSSEAAPPAAAHDAGQRERQATSVGRWVLWAAAAAGLAAFIYEIAWIRMLTLVLGASTHAFEVMLSAFILGLALGGLWIRRRVDRFRDARKTLAYMFALMAVFAALTLPAYASTFEWLSFVMRMFDASAAGYAGFNLGSHAIAAFMMMPTTFIAGMTLPLMTHWLFSSGAGERSIGNVYAANTVGAIAGVMLAVHLLLPTVGMKGTILAGAFVQLLIALLFLRRSAGGWNQAGSAVLIVALGAVVAGVALFVTLDPTRMAAGVYRTGAARLPDNIALLYMEDGKTATISLTQEEDVVTIATNGKPDASLNMGGGLRTADEVTQTLAGALPLAMHPNPRRIANIGFGSGVTSQVILRSPIVRHLDSIEIEPAMTKAAWIGFSTRIATVFSDPRSKIHYDDAKSFFASSREPYDVIVSEPSNPWVSGVATLFSAEFYWQVRRYLAADGLLVQWIQVYETDMDVVASVIKALSPNFADYAIYNAGETDILVVASKTGALPPPGAGVFAVPALARELRRVGITSLAQIQLRRIGSKQQLDPLFATYNVPRNSDYFPYVDLNAPRLRFMRRDALGLGRLDTVTAPIARLVFGESALPLPDSDATFGREQRAVLAARLAAAIATGEFRGLAGTDIKNILLIRDPPASCGAAELQQAWASAIFRVSAQTTPYLTTDELARLWAAIRDGDCYRQSGEGRRRWLDFLSLLATGDSPAVASAGLSLWQASDNGLDGEQTSELLVATAAGLVGAGRHGEARDLLATAMAAAGETGRYELILRWLSGLAGSAPLSANRP